MFKVGDWVKVKKTGYMSVIIDIATTDCNKEEIYNPILDNELDYKISELELWQPKEGEWCWSKYDGLVQILKITDERYIVFPLSTSEKDCTIEYRLGGLEPFIGELPSFIKDKHGSNN